MSDLEHSSFIISQGLLRTICLERDLLAMYHHQLKLFHPPPMTFLLAFVPL